MKKILTAIAVIALIAFAVPAFASNPFVDVPAGHWAYDSIAHLSSRGMVSGYPDGSFKGAQPMTRYEMASLVGRAVAGMEQASAQDAELLKKLVLEFKNELDALGVKVTDLDKRVAVLEDGVGGWKLRGIFTFDAKFGGSDQGDYFYTDGQANQFTKERFRLFVTKKIDENTQFYGQYRAGGGGANGTGDTKNGFWSHLYMDTKVFANMDLRVGRFYVDFEDDRGLYEDNAALFGGTRVDGFQLKKSYGIVDVTGVVGRNSGYMYEDNHGDYMHYAVDVNLNVSEKALLGATGYWSKEDGNKNAKDVSTYGVYAGYDFTPSIGVKGVYYFQNYGDIDSNAWKVALNMKQDVLKFTALWVEYSQEDNAFYSNTDRYSFGGDNYVGRNKPFGADTTSKYLFVQATQQWNDKFNSFVRYAHADFGTAGYADASEWGVGIGYQYTPAVFFELAYDQISHGSSNATDAVTGKESMIRFRTTVSF